VIRIQTVGRTDGGGTEKKKKKKPRYIIGSFFHGRTQTTAKRKSERRVFFFAFVFPSSSPSNPVSSTRVQVRFQNAIIPGYRVYTDRIFAQLLVKIILGRPSASARSSGQTAIMYVRTLHCSTLYAGNLLTSQPHPDARWSVRFFDLERWGKKKEQKDKFYIKRARFVDGRPRPAVCFNTGYVIFIFFLFFFFHPYWTKVPRLVIIRITAKTHTCVARKIFWGLWNVQLSLLINLYESLKHRLKYKICENCLIMTWYKIIPMCEDYCA
jgi:hypothetical protein